MNMQNDSTAERTPGSLDPAGSTSLAGDSLKAKPSHPEGFTAQEWKAIWDKVKGRVPDDHRAFAE